MKQKSVFLFLILASMLLFVANLWIGKVNLPFAELLRALTNAEDSALYHNIILNVRLPKAITATLVGIALPLSGLLLQELFKNPLADPSVLGITSASALGVAVVVFLFTILNMDLQMNNPWLIILAAFLGAFVALCIIGVFAYKVNSTATLIILGFMLSGFTAAIIGVMQYFSPSEKIKAYLIWGFGSLSGLSWNQITVFAICVGIGIILSLFTLKSLTAMLLGEQYAQSLGINLKKTRILILLSTAMLTASATAFAGPIAFVGLAVPHICRSYLKTANMFRLFLWVILLGIFSMLFFALITDLFPFGTLPINIITALFGAPIVISILLKNKYIH